MIQVLTFVPVAIKRNFHGFIFLFQVLTNILTVYLVIRIYIYIYKACVGKNKCSIPLRNDRFGGDPCPGISKSLLVDALCT